MALLIAVAFVAGVVTAISPCVLPVLPIVFAGGATGGRRRAYAIVAGLVASFTVFTLTATALLSALGLPDDLLRNIAIGLVFVVGLSLLWPRLAHVVERPFQALGRRSPDGTGGGFVLGISLGLLFTPCAGPVIAAVAVLAYALWWIARMLPRVREPVAEPYRPPASLFGMEIAPEKLPADVGAAAAALARAGRLREALSLLYRGALSDLVHRRGVELLASHTELEALELARKRLDPDRSAYVQTLVRTWRECAYSRRAPGQPEVEHLAAGFSVMAAP